MSQDLSFSGFKVYSPLLPAWSCLLLAKLPEADQEEWGAGAAWGTLEAEVAVGAGAAWGAEVTGAGGAGGPGVGRAGAGRAAGRAAGQVEGGLAGGVGLESWSGGQELASLVAGGPRAVELGPLGRGDEAEGCDSGDAVETARG